MFQIGDRRWRIADVGNASCFVSAMNTQTSRPQVLQNRLISHAADLLDISATLPKTPQATHISKAVATCGDGGGSELRRSSRSRERSDFVHKLRIVLKELNETTVWLQLILKGSLMTPEQMSAVVAENEELCKIIAASIKTAGGFDRT